MSWNVLGSFVGTLETPVAPAPCDLSLDTRSLVFSTFLASSILPSGPSFKEVKFSGNAEVGYNSGTIGQAIDAFAHHVVVTSKGTVLFADLQGTSSSLSTLHIY
jgi:hypothetical protein